ncbi:hypothetical protein ACOSQ2_024392 [Xanthoceras sorbifolium]
MVPEEFMIGGPIFVKGHEVDMNAEAINEYYKLETDLNHVGGLATNPILTPYNKVVAKDLQTSGKATCTSSRAVMKREELQMTFVLYNILYNLPINIGSLIRQQITAIGFLGIDALTTTWLPTDMSLNCWCMTLIANVGFDLE